MKELTVKILFYYPKEYRALVRLGIPVLIGQVGLTLQNLADNVMLGQHSTRELAAAGFVNNMFVLALLLTIGYSMGSISQIGALHAQLRHLTGGERESMLHRIVVMLRSSLLVNLLQGMLMCGALVVLYFVLPYMGQPADLLPLMRPYLVIQILSLPFLATNNAFKQFTDSVNDTAVAMTIMLIGNIWNVVGNYLLIFGNCGFPEMGIEGAAWATASSRVVFLLLSTLVFFLLPRYKEYMRHFRKAHARRAEMLTLNRLGWPIAIQMGLEAASFTIVAIFMGWMGTAVLAAHQVMLSITNLIFMFYLGVATAVAIRVSHYNGRNDMAGVRGAAFAGWQMIFCLGVLLSITAYLLRNHLSTLFTPDPDVALVMATLIWPLILYQFGDGIQVTFVNALRGLGDVRCLMRYSFIAYIVVSIPLSYLMGITLEWGPFGVWMAFPFGLSTAAFLFLRRFLWRSRHPQA